MYYEDKQWFYSDISWNRLFIAYTPDEQDALSQFCNENYLEDRKRKEWLKYLMCAMWAHVDCGDAETTDYICNFCKN